MQKQERNSNIELLRILSMLFIVLSHYTFHNGINNNLLPLGINKYILEITTLGNIGVILFILISGYFIIDQSNIKLKKILSLYFQVLFYSLGIYIIFVFLGQEPFTIKELIRSILPITFKKYWFISAYMSLYILTPFINRLLNNLNRKEHLNCILLLLLFFSILPTFTMQDYYSNELIQFIMFYTIGAYFKKYPNNILKKDKWINNMILIMSTLFLLISPIIFDLISQKIDFFINKNIYFFNRNSIISIVFCISLFTSFLRIPNRSNKAINAIASCVFGVYLIHDNDYIRKFLWIDLLKNANYVKSNYFIIHLLLSVISVFIICIFIEYIRKNIIEKTTNKLFNNKIDHFQEWVSKKTNNIYKKINIK